MGFGLGVQSVCRVERERECVQGLRSRRATLLASSLLSFGGAYLGLRVGYIGSKTLRVDHLDPQFVS